MKLDDSISTQVDEDARRAFEKAWQSDEPHPIEEFLPTENDPRYLPTLEELVHIELELSWKRWRRGKAVASAETHAGDLTVGGVSLAPQPLEHYFDKYAELSEESIALRLLQQEISLRRKFGELPTPEEYQRRFPELSLADTGDSDDTVRASAEDALDYGDDPMFANRVGPGDQLGDYTLEKRLGAGGMGAVFAAHQRSTDRKVAVKVIRQDWLNYLSAEEKERALDRFRNEAKAAAQLSHPNIVTIFEVGEANGQLFYSMELIKGMSLSALVKENPLAPHQAAKYLSAIASAAHHAHEQKILHRDVKPQNIMIDSADRPLIADFGVSKQLDATTQLTHTGEMLGTPCFMPPEQARGASDIDRRADVYSLGATLYFVLTGRPPFLASTVAETVQQLLSVDPVSPFELNPAIGEDLATICLRCLEKEPSRRYPTAQSLADDLERYQRGEPIHAKPISWVGKLDRWRKRNPLVAALSLATCVCMLLAIGLGCFALIQTRAALQQSEKNYEQAQQVFDDVYTEISENELIEQPGLQPLRRRLLEKSLAFYEEHLAAHQTESPSFAFVHFRVAEISVQVDDPEAAIEHYDRAITLQRNILSEQPEAADAKMALADSLNQKGELLSKLGQHEAAISLLDEAGELREELAKAEPENVLLARKFFNLKMNQALVIEELGDAEKSLKLQKQSQTSRLALLAKNKDHANLIRDAANGHYNLAATHVENEDASAAEPHLAQAIALYEQHLKLHPHSFVTKERLALCYRLQADFFVRLDKLDVAIDTFDVAQSHAQRLVDQNPDVDDFKQQLAAIVRNRGDVRMRLVLLQAAAMDYQAAIVILAEIHDLPAARDDLVRAYLALATCQAAAGELEKARSSAEQAVEKLNSLRNEFPRNQAYIRLEQQLAAIIELINNAEAQGTGTPE